MARVLGAIRQSKTRDRAVSPEVQRDKIETYASANGHTVVKITEDLSRSGKISAFKRPELGPWLTDSARIAKWDILCATKLDRACRNTADYLKLREWCAANGKQLMLLNNPELDESKPAGKAMGSIQAVFAEFERDMASERSRETRAELQDQGRWTGGRVPYGFRADKREEGFYVVPDEGSTADIARTMAHMAIEGQSNGQIQRWLNANGHLTSAGNKWLVERVRLVLRSEHMAELLSAEDYAKLRAALRSREQTRGERVGGHLLLRVAYCMTCKRPLYGTLKRNRSYRGYYRCLNCGTNIRMEKLEEQTENSLLFIAGDEKIHRKVVDPGKRRTAEQANLTRQIEALKSITGADVSAAIAELQGKLDAISDEPDTEHWEPTKETVAKRWDRLDYTGRGRFLRSANVRVEADRTHFEFRITDAGIIQLTHVRHTMPVSADNP